MTYDDIPHLSAKIKPKQQKVGLPSDGGRGGEGWHRWGLMEVNRPLGTRSPEKEQLENELLAEPGKLKKESFQKERG